LAGMSLYNQYTSVSCSLWDFSVVGQSKNFKASSAGREFPWRSQEQNTMALSSERRSKKAEVIWCLSGKLRHSANPKSGAAFVAMGHHCAGSPSSRSIGCNIV
jgi:hypothetical protein